MSYRDITKTGEQGWKAIQEQNELNPDYKDWFNNNIDLSFLPQNRGGLTNLPQQFSARSLGLEDYGNSRYDSEVAILDELINFQDYRGQRQSSFNKIAAGIGKGVALAATTFIDGTLGLLTGTVEGIGALARGEGGLTAVSKLWHNSVSDALKRVNDEMEKILPNYRTQAEQEREWWQNLGTANFWADIFIKNLGFTVGAFYSGKAWNAALKAAGVLKNAASAQVVGSVTSAVNEGRIEANNNSSDFLAAQREQLMQGYNQALQEINNNPAYLTQEARNREIAKLNARYEQLDKDAQERADKMGLAVLIGNTAILSAGNMWQFGKLYSRGFDNAKGIMGRIQSGIEREGITGGVREGGKYVAETMTKGQIRRRALTIPLTEGFEEMNQAWIAEHAGLYRSSDDPDAYYKALTNSEYQYKTRDWASSFTESLANTYGSRDRWQEFAVGWLAGAIGMPTVGRVNNSDANTWLGKGKSIGISGGFLGEMRNLKAQNEQRASAVMGMNQFLDNLNGQLNHFAQSNYFTDVMDGYAADKDRFEWTNARDNDMFAGFSAFRKAGRLDDFYEIINQDFENLSDEKLQEIALNTTPDVLVNEDGTVRRTDANGNVLTEGWRDKKTGQLLSETPEGREQMRQELTAKRDRIQKALQEYEKSLEAVRGIGNNALTDDQENELAWLNWKTLQFKDRYDDMKAGNTEFIRSLSDAIKDFQYRQSGQLFEEKQNERVSQGKRKFNKNEGKQFRPVLNPESADTQKIMKAMDVASQYLDALQSASSISEIAEVVNANPEITKMIDEFGLEFLEPYLNEDYDVLKTRMSELKDMARISAAYKTFYDRYKEFTENPLGLVKNREKIDKQNADTKQAVEDVRKKDDLRKMSVQDMIAEMENGGIDFDDAFSQLENEGDTKEKLESAKDIVNVAQQVTDKIDQSNASDPVKKAAKVMFIGSKTVSNDTDELLDLSRQIYNDPQIILEQDPSLIQGLTQENAAAYVSNLMDEAKSLLSQIKGNIEEELADLPSSGVTVKTLNPDGSVTTVGHDGVDKGTTANQRAKQKEEDAKKEAKDKNSQTSRLKVAQRMASEINAALNGALNEVRMTTLTQELVKLLGDFHQLYDKGSNLPVIMSTLKNTSPYKTASTLITSTESSSELLDTVINNYYKELNKQEDIEEEPIQQTENNESATPEITSEDVDAQTDRLSNTNLSGEEGSNDIYNYWKPTITLLPIRHDKFDLRPFYEVAENMKLKGGKPRFTDKQLQRIKAVGEYLTQNGAFKRVDRGEIQKGDVVKFKIVSALNEKAGETVILITDSKGNVIGDLMSPYDKGFDKQIGLRMFVANILKEYNEAGSPEEFTSKYTSRVDKMMTGQVPFIANRYSLNEIFSDNGKPVSFKLGIATSNGVSEMIGTPGVTKNATDKIKEVTISALSAKKGQPFLLLETADKKGNRQYIPVPFNMSVFNTTVDGTLMSKAIENVIERIINGNTQQVLDLKDALTELLVIPGLYINYEGDNITINSDKGIVYTGSKTDQEGRPSVKDQIIRSLKLKGFSYQVSRKYINGTYNGQDYNRMIGEIAQTNLNIGSTHTISNWFTINPLDANGKMISADSPTTTGVNKTAKAQPQQGYAFTWNGTVLYNDNNHIYDTKGKEYTGKNADRAKAYSFGLMTNQDMIKPYLTEWGWFNATSMQFVEEPKAEVIKTLGTEELQEQPEKQTKESAEDIMQKSGLLRDKKNLAIWTALDNKQKDALANKPSIDKNRLFSQLWASFDAASGTFNTDVNTLLGVDKTATVVTSEPQKFTAPINNQENLDLQNREAEEAFDILSYIANTLRYVQKYTAVTDERIRKVLNKLHNKFYLTKTDVNRAKQELENFRIEKNFPEGIFLLKENANSIEVTINTTVLKDKIERNKRNVNFVDLFETVEEAQAVKDVLEFLSAKTGLKYETVSFDNAKNLNKSIDNNTNAFIYNNVCYFIEGRKLNVDVASEEMLHPFINAIYNQNSGLFSTLLADAQKAFPKLRLEISESYKGKSKDIRDQELVTQALSRAFRTELENHPQRRSISELLEHFFSWVRDLFKAGNKDFILTDEINTNTTLIDLAKILNSELKLTYNRTFGNIFRENKSNMFDNQSKEIQDDWITAGGTPEDFRQDWYEIDQHCKM